MTILVTISMNLGESVTLQELRRFLDAAEQNNADSSVDLREYDEENDLVGLAAVGQFAADGESGDGIAEDDGDDEGVPDDEQNPVTACG